MTSPPDDRMPDPIQRPKIVFGVGSAHNRATYTFYLPLKSEREWGVVVVAGQNHTTPHVEA